MSFILETNGVSPSPKGFIKESDTAHFVTDVIEASTQVPVIVDFWASWCTPCKTLTPILEKTVLQTGGAVKIVKINVDKNQALAGQLRVQSIPTVLAFKDGRPVDGLTGAVPESKIKQFVDGLIGKTGSPLDEALKQAETALEAGNIQTATTLFKRVLQQDNKNIDALVGLARCHIAIDDLESAHQLIDDLSSDMKTQPKIVSLVSVLDLEQSTKDAGDLEHLRSAATKNPDDHQAYFDLANAFYSAKQPEAALDTLLDSMRRNPTWNNNAAHQQIIKIFEALGHNHPITTKARRRLSTTLFS